MADLEQALQEEMGMSGRWTAFGVSRPVARPRTGDEGGPTPYSEYSLHFKMTLVPRWDGRGQAMDGSPSPRSPSLAQICSSAVRSLCLSTKIGLRLTNELT